ncbi:protein AMBP isoform 2-T2 [Thomomys bottae]
MQGLGNLLLVLMACLAVRAGPVPAALDDIQVQENFDILRIYGKWFNLAIGSTCPWLRSVVDKMSVSTLVLGRGPTDAEVSVTSTRWRRGICKETSATYEKTSTAGKFIYHKPMGKQRRERKEGRMDGWKEGRKEDRKRREEREWNVTMECYVVHTNYDEYAIFLTKKFSHHHGTTITAKLYGREPQVRESLLQEFREVALEVGIPQDSIFTMADRGECVPGKQAPEPPEPTPPSRARRAVLPQENEGSGTEPLVSDFMKKEDSCQLGHSAGPCLGLLQRYFYNGTSMACEMFTYGGCLGNGNNFVSEKECLQTCRTVAACNLPIVQGPCKSYLQLWAYDAVQGKCVLFTYGGCQGNGNKFYSEKECKEYCGIPGEGDEELLRLSN